MSLPEVHIETDGAPMNTKVVLTTDDGLVWDISNFTTKIQQLETDGKSLRAAEITLIAHTDLPMDGEPLTIDANER